MSSNQILARLLLLADRAYGHRMHGAYYSPTLEEYRSAIDRVRSLLASQTVRDAVRDALGTIRDISPSGPLKSSTDLYRLLLVVIESLNTPNTPAPSGSWTRQMPEAPGRYWIRTLDGLEAGTATVYILPDAGLACSEYPMRGPNGLTIEGTEWGGWWWSEPLVCPKMERER